MRIASLANGVVHVTGSTASLYAFDAAYGEMLGRWDTGSSYYGTPAISDGVVYVNGRDANAAALALLAGTGAVRSKPRAPEISRLHPNLALEVSQR